jgi:hypothetical protein
MIGEAMEDQEQKPITKVRQEFVLSFYSEYKNVFGEKCLEPFPKCLGIVKSTFETIDKETGEIFICYPDIEEWKRELRKFFMKSPNNWYRINNKCTFYSFCNNYGRFNHHVSASDPTKKGQYNKL